MSVQNMPAKSKLIFSKLILNLMNKQTVSSSELTQISEINQEKAMLREEETKLKEKFLVGFIDGKTLESETRLCNFKITKLDLNYYQLEISTNAKQLYYKRLELIHRLLNNDSNESLSTEDDIYLAIIEAIKDEVMTELQTKLKIYRLILQANVYSKELSREEEYRYRDQVYNLELEIKELKKVLSVNKLNEAKLLTIDKLINNSGYSILNNLYENELLGIKSK